MPDKPVPLREALQEAIEALIDAETDVLSDYASSADLEYLPVARDRVAFLLPQIPAEIEANDAE